MGKAKSTFKEKVDWMVRHHASWAGWPEAAMVSDDELIRMMQRDGLISFKANLYDIMDFGKLVAAARQQITDKKYANS